MSTPVVVIRPYRDEDANEVRAVIKEATIFPVNQFFLQSLTREIFYQAIIFMAAILFIFCGVHLYYTVISVPIVVVITYLGIWVAHYYKAVYLHRDLKNIPQTYMKSDKTNFYVAEAHFPRGFVLNDSFKNSLAFANDTEFAKMNENGAYTENRNFERKIIGTVAIMRDKDSAVIAWLRRMAVCKSWRGYGVGKALVDQVIKFCSMKGFVAIELLTTECHDNARRLYEKKGFEVTAFYHKKIFNLSGIAITMYLMHFKTRPYKEIAQSP